LHLARTLLKIDDIVGNRLIGVTLALGVWSCQPSGDVGPEASDGAADLEPQACEELAQDLCEGAAACVWSGDACATREASCAVFTDRGACERAKCGWNGIACVDSCCVDKSDGCVDSCDGDSDCSCSIALCASCCGQCVNDADCAEGYHCTAVDGKFCLPACDGTSDCTGSCVLPEPEGEGEGEDSCTGCLSDDDCGEGEVCAEPSSTEDSCACLEGASLDICAGTCTAESTTVGDPEPGECCFNETTGTCVPTCNDLINCLCTEKICDLCGG
jgi:hypothetical protein